MSNYTTKLIDVLLPFIPMYRVQNEGIVSNKAIMLSGKSASYAVRDIYQISVMSDIDFPGV